MTLSKRAIAEELMDADDLALETYTEVVADLAKVNAVTMAARPTIGFLDRIEPTDAPLRILDVGFGDGDMLRRICRWGQRCGRTVELVGIDLNPRSAVAATRHTPDSMPITYLTGDYADLTGQQWDVVISSLVAHHMSHGQLVAFLRFMEAEAQRGWFVNDLHRHGFAYRGYPLLARIARWHPIVRLDGTLSIARSYRPGEWLPLLAEAGIDEARVRRVFPFRLCVERLR